MPIRSTIYTIPFGQDISGAIARTILRDTENDVSDTTLMLPNNRAVRAMTEAFVREASPGLLLPRMAAIGDLDMTQSLGPLLDPLTGDEQIPPVVSHSQRLTLLARLVMKHRTRSITLAEALRLAAKLVGMIDELEIEKVDPRRLQDSDSEAALADHWQSAYRELMAILPGYYAELRQQNLLGPAERRNRLLALLKDRLTRNPPRGKVIAAGITTSAPAIAAVLRAIAHLPHGVVILPGVDLDMGEDQWQALGSFAKPENDAEPTRRQETHPQFHLKLLLDRMGIRRSEIETFPDAAQSRKGQAIADIFCMPRDSCQWRDLPAKRKQMPHLSLLEAADIAEEARAIAIKVRGTLENPGRRIAIVTPDRELAIRVSAQLRRWEINVDDSAGTGLLQTPPGTLILALAEAIAQELSPVSALAIAKHPLVRAGERRLAWLEQARKLDLDMRGPATSSQLANWSEFHDIVAPLRQSSERGLRFALETIRAIATELSGGQIWKGTAGRELATLWEEAEACELDALGAASSSATPAVIAELFGCAVVRPPYGGHPRVAIYGLLEARMQTADLVICGGLNEGAWPQIAQPDPWLAPAIRRHLELPTLDRNIGLSAHDLAMALGAEEVLLTRAKRDRSGPTVASRFLLRIKALLGDQLRLDTQSVLLARAIDRPTVQQPLAPRPAPRPSIEQRPKTMSITAFDRLKSDPYSFYARHVMRFRALEAVDATPSYAWRGNVVHDLLENWFRFDGCAPDALMRRAQALLSDPSSDPILRALWQPRVVEGIRWIAETTSKLQSEQGRTVIAAEEPGETDLCGITIAGRVDRIDRLRDGRLAIIDYKTGQPPSRAQASAGYAMQLGLVGLLAERGAIKSVEGKAGKFEYWSLAKGKGRSFGFISEPTAGKANDAHIDADDFVDFVKAEAEAAIRNWIIGDAPFTAKLRPEFASDSDYDHLMRLQEWDGRQPIADSTLP